MESVSAAFAKAAGSVLAIVSPVERPVPGEAAEEILSEPQHLVVLSGCEETSKSGVFLWGTRPLSGLESICCLRASLVTKGAEGAAGNQKHT